MPPSAYRFDGRAWTQERSLQDFQAYLAARRNGPEIRLNSADLRESGFPWPFPPE